MDDQLPIGFHQEPQIPHKLNVSIKTEVLEIENEITKLIRSGGAASKPLGP